MGRNIVEIKDPMVDTLVDTSHEELVRVLDNAIEHGLTPTPTEATTRNTDVDLSTGITIRNVKRIFMYDEDLRQRLKSAFSKKVSKILTSKPENWKVRLEDLEIEDWDNGPSGLSLHIIILLKEV